MPSWMSAPGDASPTFMAHAVGIGVVEAAAGAARAIAKHEPDFVLLVGTCGFYDRSKATASAASRAAPLAIGQVVVLGVTALVDPAVTLGVAATLPPISKLHVADGELLAEVSSSGSSQSGGPSLAAVRVATTASLTTSDEVAARLSEQWDVEHLESAGVATACKAAAVRFGAILGIANRVGSTGRDEWAKHRQAAEHAAGATAPDPRRPLAIAVTERPPPRTYPGERCPGTLPAERCRADVAGRFDAGRTMPGQGPAGPPAGHGIGSTLQIEGARGERRPLVGRATVARRSAQNVHRMADDGATVRPLMVTCVSLYWPVALT